MADENGNKTLKFKQSKNELVTRSFHFMPCVSFNSILIAILCTFSSFRNSVGSDGLAEWGIIELQGDLEVRDNEMMHGQFIGDLNYDKYGQPVSETRNR